MTCHAPLSPPLTAVSVLAVSFLSAPVVSVGAGDADGGAEPGTTTSALGTSSAVREGEREGDATRGVERVSPRESSDGTRAFDDLYDGNALVASSADTDSAFADAWAGGNDGASGATACATLASGWPSRASAASAARSAVSARSERTLHKRSRLALHQ